MEVEVVIRVLNRMSALGRLNYVLISDLTPGLPIVTCILLMPVPRWLARYCFAACSSSSARSWVIDLKHSAAITWLSVPSCAA